MIESAAMRNVRSFGRTVSLLGVLLASTAFGGSAHAVTPADPTVATGKTFGARVDLGTHRVFFRSCSVGASFCDAAAGSVTSLEIPIATEGALAAWRKVELGVPAETWHLAVASPNERWEALFVAGKEQPVFVGVTPPSKSATTALQFHPRDARSEFAIVGEVAGGGSKLCGEALTLAAPRTLNPKTLGWASISMQRLGKDRRDHAIDVAGAALEERPTVRSRALEAVGASDGTRGEALSDGDPKTAWREKKPGEGRGEFVSFRVDGDMALDRVVIVPLSSEATPTDVAPKSVYFATEANLYRVKLPSVKAGQAVEVRLPAPVKSTCLSVVLDDAEGDHPDVSLAEVSAVTRFDGMPLSSVLGLLDASGDEAKAATAYLKSADTATLAALAASYPTLSERGRGLAMDVAMSREGCVDQGALLTAAIAGADKDLAQRARSKFERCGKKAEPALRAALATPARAQVAPLLALVAPASAAEALVTYLGPDNTTDRVIVRDALARALRTAPPSVLRESLALVKGTPRQSDYLRAVSQRLSEIADVAYPLLAAPYAVGAPLEVTSFDERYMYVEPLAILAKSGHLEAKALLARVAKDEKEEAIRARVLERVREVPGFEETMTAALVDKNPRVRALAAQGITRDGARPALLRLMDDPWTFVRTDVLRALERLPADPVADDALDKAVTNDPSAEVRMLAARALGAHRAIGHRETLRDVMDEPKEEWSVRGAAAWALGNMCSTKDVGKLTDYAKASVVPGSNQGDIELGIAATEALGKLHPTDIRERLAPVLGSKIRGPIRRAAESAVEGKGACGK